MSKGPPGEAYVGNEVCRACHAEAFRFMKRHPIQKRGRPSSMQASSVMLVVFNVTVLDLEPGGPCSLKTLEGFKNVGCENCHGPGQAHVADPSSRDTWGDKFVAAPNESTCLTCHTPEHSDLFDYAKYLPKVLGIGHGIKNP